MSQIIDFHTHIYPDWLRSNRESYLKQDITFGELFSHPKSKMVTADELINEMNKQNIDHSVVMGIGWTNISLAQKVNDYIIEAIHRYPNRLTGFAGINPAWGKTAIREIERCFKSGMRGIGELHPYSQGFDITDKLTMSPMMEIIQNNNMLLTTHASEPVGHLYQGKGDTRPEILYQFISEYPQASIICAHWGGGLPFYGLMPEIKTQLSNTYFDSAASPYLYDNKIFETIVKILGSAHCLFGSDFPLIKTNRIVRQIQCSDLSESEKSDLLSNNASRLLGLN